MAARLYIYKSSPIDSWDLWTPLGDAIEGARREGVLDPFMSVRAQELERTFETAKRIAGEKLDWEGEIREGPYITAIPACGENFAFALAWKQNSLGVTFIASGVELTHLVQGGCAVEDWTSIDLD